MLFLKEKPVAVILTIKKAQSELYLSEIARRSKTTFVYVINFIKKLEKNGLVKITKENKKRLVSLTDKGLDFAQLISDLNNKEENEKETVSI